MIAETDQPGRAGRSAPAPEIRLTGTARMNGIPLFGPLDLRVPGGGWTCLLGPSGVGKTTLLRLVAGLVPGVAFKGDVSAADGAPLSGRVALMAQGDLLLPWLSVPENVMLGARLRGEVPDRARAHQVIAAMGLTAHVTKRPAQLSGGQRQRVALARTLMEDRPVVLLDEPFSALDARTRAQMQELAAQTLKGRTVLMVTHDPAEAARLGERILLLDEHGLSDVPAPKGAIPRPPDAPDVLAAQAALMKRLRGGA